MKTERVQQEPGYVLHTRPWQNSSLLVEFFTRQHGRLGAIAQGARRSKSRQSALLQPMQALSLSWSQRGELARLTGAESLPGRPSVPAAGRGLWCGLYMNELLMRLTHRGDPHPELFDSFETALAELGQDDEMALRRFECALLAECGYGLPFGVDGQGRPVRVELKYSYSPDAGFVPTADGAYAGEMLLCLERGDELGRQHRMAAQVLLREAIERHIDRPLQTAAILRSLQRMQSATH